MNEFVQNMQVLAGGLAVLWIVMIGGCFVLQRRDWAARVFAFPFRMSFRAIRWMVGGFFLGIARALAALGRAIRGR